MGVHRQSRWCRAFELLGCSLLLTATVLAAAAPDLHAEPQSTPATPNYLTSPYHGVVDGDGRVIPCRCRFNGREFRLGEAVCMTTHVGTVIARCDLMQNNTSWIPTSTPCELSSLSQPPPPAMRAQTAALQRRTPGTLIGSPSPRQAR